MKTADCEKLSTHFFLQQQGWSSYILPLSLLAGVFTYARVSRRKMNMHSWTMIVGVVVLTYVVLSVLARMLIPSLAHQEFIDRCERCQMDPKCGGPRELTVEEVLSYTGLPEHFQNEEEDENEQSREVDTININEIKNIKLGDEAIPETPTTEEEESREDGTQADEVETFVGYAPYEAPAGYQRNITYPKFLAHDNRVPQEATPLMPGQIAQAQVMVSGPSLYNEQWASADISQPQGGFEAVPANAMCMMPQEPCANKCSGDAGQNQQCADFVAPVPGPTWQPQRAATVQARLASGNYVPSRCPLN